MSGNNVSLSSAAYSTPNLLAVCLIVAVLLVGLAPVGVSIIAVALFAGPHNFVEFGYFLRKMPARWGRLRNYFLLGICGTVLLSAGHILLGMVPQSPDTWRTAASLWATTLTLWVLSLATLRQRQNPRRDWPACSVCCWLLIAAAWLWPAIWLQALVFVHPLVAFWFLDRQLVKRRPDWVADYRRALWMLPVGLAVVIFLQRDLAPLNHSISRELLARHAGANLFNSFPTDALIAAHAYLELLHYVIWIVLIPAVAGTSPIPALRQIPLAKSRWIGPLGLRMWFAAASALVMALWIGFPCDYWLTRQIYFTFAVVHVLAEIPFLIREL